MSISEQFNAVLAINTIWKKHLRGELVDGRTPMETVWYFALPLSVRGAMLSMKKCEGGNTRTWAAFGQLQLARQGADGHADVLG
jgi:hypothetical protein